MKTRVQTESIDVIDAGGPPAGAPAKGRARASTVSLDSAIFKNVKVALRATLGEVSMSVDELMKLEDGSIVTLDRQMNELVELTLNDVVIGRGEIVAVDDNFGIRIVEIAEPA